MSINATSYGAHLKHVLSFYDSLMENQNLSGLVIPSGIPKQQFLDDNPYPFKVNVHFKALLSVTDVPHSYIIYQPGCKPVLVFFQPEDYWHVVPADPEGIWVDSFAIKIVRGKDDWRAYLPSQRQGLVWIGEPQKELASLNISTINPEKLLHAIHFRRASKSPYEIACLREASLTAAKGHLVAKEVFLTGGSEMEIHLAYLQATAQKEEDLPYGNIVALNNHSSVLHYTDLENQQYPTSNLHSFLIDAGATHNGYCSDITRTWAYQEGEFSELIQRFDKLQLELIAELAIGKSYVDMHILTHLKIAELLYDFEFIYCDAETALATGISSTFFPHGLGHLLGLQVHDIGGHQSTALGDINFPPTEHPYLRLTKTIETGFCVTMEPGLYFIEMLLKKLAESEHTSLVNWPKVEAFKKYGGIRIEDDVVITADGTENLTRNAFAQLHHGI